LPKLFKLMEQPDVIASRMPQEEAEEFMAAVVANKMAFFVPNGAQEKYIETVGYSLDKSRGGVKLPIITSTFANGVGKTTATVQICGNLMEGPQSGWFDYPFFYNWKYPKKIWYCSTALNIQDNVVPMFKELLQEGIFEEDYSDSKEGKQYVARMTYKDWEVTFKTYEQADDTFESSTVGLIIFDEPAPLGKWKRIKSRRRMGCVVIYPMTPLWCPPYIMDEIGDALRIGKKGYFSCEADVYSSCKKRGVRGHRDPEIIDEEVAGYDEEEKEARVYGKFMYFSGRILPTISKERNVRTEEQIPLSKHAIILMSVDPHDARPCAVGWWGRNPDGRWICLDEAPVFNNVAFWDLKRGGMPLKEEVSGWKVVEDALMKRIGRHSNEVFRILDRHYGWQTRVTKSGVNTTLAEVFSRIGEALSWPLYFTESYSSNSPEGEIEVGHKLLREADMPMADGESGFILRPHCVHHLNGLTHYIKQRMVGKMLERKAAADGEIVPKFKDFVDVPRMAVGSGLVAHKPADQGDSISKWAEAIDMGLDYFDNQ
jgi:hypothetical protein